MRAWTVVGVVILAGTSGEFRNGTGDRCGVVLGCAAVEKGHGEGRTGDGFAQELTRFIMGLQVSWAGRPDRIGK